MNSSSTKILTSLSRRVRIMTIVFALLFAMISLRVFYLQIITGPAGAEAAKLQRMEQETIPSHRGTIYDANSIVLASSADRYVVAVDQVTAKNWVAVDCTDSNQDTCNQIDGHPVGANGVVGISRILAKPLGRTSAELAYDLIGDQRYKIVAKDITPEVQRQILKLHVGGILQMKATSTRVYPNANIAGSEVGVANTSSDGQIQAQAGLELEMDEELSGKSGTRWYERGAQGERIPTGEIKEEPAKDGRDVKSTIDVDVQWKMQQVLDAQCAKVKASICMSVVEKVKTGEIVAIAANNEENAGSQAIAEHGSRVFGTAYEPGSVIKTLTAASLINEGIAQPESKYSVPDHYTTRFNQVIEDYKPHPTVTLTLAGIVGNSYNTGTTKASEPWSVESRYDYYTRFGLGELTGVGFPGETQGLLYEPQYWDDRTRDLVLFGQGMSVSVLQIVNAYATIGNDGKNPVPTLIAATREQGGDWLIYPKTKEGAQVVSAESASKTRSIMESCVAHAGCRTSALPDYRVGGKTGTAEQIAASGTDYVHSYIGMFPMDDPQYVVGFFVRDRDGSSNMTINSTIPNFKEIATFIAQKYGIPPSAPAGYIPPIS